MTKEEVLKNCKVEGYLVSLPKIVLDRDLYTQVAKSLNLIGGKWKGGKTQAFVFDTDPTDLLEEVANGTKRNLKKEFQFFATPDKLADRLVSLAEIKEDDWILEPSAGQGAIINAINRVLPEQEVDYYELMPNNRLFLEKIKTVVNLGNDFLEAINPPDFGWDKIIANPPFSNNQDIDHVYKMYDLLDDGGRIVSIMSNHWRISNNKKEKTFKTWLSNLDHRIEEIDAGEFKESGTMVSACIVIINKKR